MAEKVYIVTSGEYSDYHIVTVFTDKHDAEVYCAVNNGSRWAYDNYMIEEYAVGEIQYNPEKKIGYHFSIGANGKLSLDGYFMPKVGKDAIVPNVVKGNTRSRLSLGVVATSIEQAEKIAQDLISKYKAEKEGL